MRITNEHRRKLKFYLKKFYSFYPNERQKITNFVKYVKKRINMNKDAWFGVSGETGSGKSYLVLIFQILWGGRFHLEENITYIPKGNEIMEKFLKLNKNTLLIDEAAKQMRKVDWQNKQQQKVNVAAMTDRFRSNVVFLNMPNFNEFTKSMRTGNIQFRAIIPYRTENYARVIIQRKSRNWRSDDPWCDIQASKIYETLEKKRIDIDNERILNIERNLPTTIMDFIIPNLELILPEVTDKYQELKAKSREIDMMEEQTTKDKKNIYKLKYEKLLVKLTKTLYHNTLGIGEIKQSKSAIAKEMGIAPTTFSKFLDMHETELEPKKANFRKNIQNEAKT